jgi:hypothetical protein
MGKNEKNCRVFSKCPTKQWKKNIFSVRRSLITLEKIRGGLYEIFNVRFKAFQKFTKLQSLCLSLITFL